MYRTKKDVDKHVENLISKLTAKEFKTRAYSVARLYFEVGDYSSCQRYVEQYLTQKDNNAAAHKLLGQALQKLGQKEKALEHYKISLDIDSTQTSTILDICELLVDDEVVIDPGRAKYWCEKAEATFPRHPVTFRLRERLLTMSNPDPEVLIKLLTSELAVRPKDAVLHCRLLKHYVNMEQINDAFQHCCSVEFGKHPFTNNYLWYDTLAEIVNHNRLNTNDWLYQLLLLTIKERLCVLSLTETPSGTSRSLNECSDFLNNYDQAIEKITKAGAPSGFGEFHAALLQHHRGQFTLHAATLLLKKSKKGQLSWRDASRTAAPLMLMAWQTVPLDLKVNWLSHAPEKQQVAVHRWYKEGTYRCSQAGHYLLANIQDKTQTFLDKISQTCSGSHWRDKFYEKIFSSRENLAKIKSSHLASEAFCAPVLRLPRRTEVEAYDVDAQIEYSNSLHHFVWILQNYKNYAHFKCSIFAMLTPSASNLGPESLSKLDVHAFLYFATLTSHQQKYHETSYMGTDKPNVLPANITDLLCPLSHMKWWDCAYKFSQNELGTELTDIRATLSRGIEVVRCIDNHGLDPELLCLVARIFCERAKYTTAADEKNQLQSRAGLYYSSALPLLEKLKSKMMIKMPEKRLFDYTHKELGSKELKTLIEESKLYVAVNYLNECEYDKAIDLLSNLKSLEAFYQLSQTYKKLALEETSAIRDGSIDTRSKAATLIMKAKSFAYKALDRVKDTELNKEHPLYSEIQQLIEDIETFINRMDLDITGNNDFDAKYSSDENISSTGSEQVPMRNNHHMIRNLSSTPKHSQQSHSILTNYRTAIDSQLHESSKVDPQIFEKIETQIKTFQKRLADEFAEQTKSWFEENRRLGNQIMSTIQSDIQNTTEQFKFLKISVDHIKDQLDECRNECKDVGDLKKQLADLKKEVNKLKKASAEQVIDENDLYNLDDEFRSTEGTSNFTAQLPFPNPQVMPQFNQRLVPPFPMPPNPYQIYTQSLYNLYNQYSQFSQNPSMPGAPPLFDPTKLAYPGMYPTPDQMYLDVAHLVPPPVPPVPQSVSSIPSMATAAVPPLVSVPAVTASPASAVTTSKPMSSTEAGKSKDTRSLPVNVVITSSDPLPSSTTTPAPILSVTIPPKHIKGTPHNYQIAMPSVNETNVASPVFSFPAPDSKTPTSTPRGVVHWNGSMFKPSQSTNTIGASESSIFNTSNISDTFDKSIGEGAFTGNLSNTSLNKSRTLSERSNTSIENYDPCPDFKPIIPLPDEIKVTTGEENETVIFSARAKLFRFIEKQWKERGIGEIKLLKHNVTGKVRVLMRREQIHKICANHTITPEMVITPMKNETKAYFWVANDFADETVVLEKFCVRFKTSEIAQSFYTIFEKARQTASSNNNTSKVQDEVIKINMNKLEQSEPVKSTPSTGFPVSTSQSKTQFGGFTFTSTPTLKAVEDAKKPEIKLAQSETPTTKVNVFSNLSFNKPSATSPFSNLFTSTSTSIANSNSITNTSISATKHEVENKLNSSDIVEEFEPNVEFKPVVPLPALVDQKTGEEDENVLFEHRAKLLRFDAGSKEWKERGLGNIKLLVQKDNVQKVRLLMRREQIMKVCCNHAVTKEMTFQKMPNMDKAVTWCAKDFSDGELVPETFCLRFKTVPTCDDFMEAIRSAQTKMKDESKVAKEEQNAATQNTGHSGFGDKFKPKAGSWHCDACYTNNLESFLKCACCDQPKPQSATDTNATDNKPITTTSSLNWGDKFKPKPGSWQCTECFIRNESSVDRCVACGSQNNKESNMEKKEHKTVATNVPKFNFGIPQQVANNAQKNESSAIPTSGWGEKFKPKEGTWECKQCFIRNESDKDNCSACTNPRDPNASVKQIDKLVTVTSGPKFMFGIPAQANAEKPKSETTSIFDGTGAHKFSFGIPSATQEKTPNIIAFGDQKPFEVIKSDKDSPLNLIATNKETSTQSIATPVKPALLPTPKIENTTFGDKETHATFDFVFKPKTPPKGKSPIKSPKAEGDESDDNEYASEDEGHHIHFNPIVPLPDKIEVVTGEENEIELYGHRAKLFRFVGGEWKERGIGIVKILKHKETGKLRVVMRREQVHKICLNHALTTEMIYTPKDEKTWLFAANDFSEGELTLHQFCLRFKTKDIAVDFKDAIDNARNGKAIVKREIESTKKDCVSEDVIFVSETLATPEEKQRAKELMLPENFYTYKNKEPCKGCRGCDDESDTKSKSSCTAAYPSALKLPSISTGVTLNTPVKTPVSCFQSPSTSFYGTPSNFDKTVDGSIFRTPLGSLGSNTNSVSPVTPTNTPSDKDATNKENAFAQKNLFGEASRSNIFTTQEEKPSIFGINAGDTQQNIPSSKATILATPKLGNLNTSGGEKEAADAKSVFGSAHNKSIFGENTTKSVFGENTTKSVFGENTTKSVFGGNPSPSIFGNVNAGVSSNKSIFGVAADNKDGDAKSIFAGAKSGNIFCGTGQNANNNANFASNPQKHGSDLFGSSFKFNTQPQGFGSGASLFGQWTTSDQNKSEENTATATKEDAKENESAVKDTPFKVDNTLSFAALSSGNNSAGFAAQKKPDFQWEGAGQQLFTSAQRAAREAEKANNESGEADDSGAGADEEYDPHYEPIVPLPDKIVVTTGEEDEVKMFGERCKLYRYDDKSREWKERGVGELKVLHHPERNTYRLLLRREQVHKAVLNMLIFMDLELLPMKNSDRAWTWAGRNFAESAQGEQETLAVRFKSVELAAAFKDKIVECTRKLQAAAAQAVKEQKESRDKPDTSVAPLRLPKHLESSARADTDLSVQTEQSTQRQSQDSGEPYRPADTLKQVTFQEPEEEHYEEEVEDYDNDYDHDADDYYNDDEETAAFFECEGSALITQAGTQGAAQDAVHTECENAQVQVLFDQDVYSPKILIADNDTGEILADMLIHTDTEFQLDTNSCTWSGTDYTSNEPVDKTVTINFADSATAMQFYDSCETSKGATYSSTDPES